MLERRIEELRLRNMTLTGYLARANVLEVYRRSDVLFAQLKDTPTLNATGLPSKLHEYMATGKPIVYAGKGLAPETLERIGCGVCVAPETSEAIADAISQLLADEALMDEMGKRGRTFVETGADRERVFEELVSALSERL
jgi:glycosyltransferase involved in cell wall biosynthesis